MYMATYKLKVLEFAEKSIAQGMFFIFHKPGWVQPKKNAELASQLVLHKV